MESNKPFSQACENNKQPILNVLKKYLIGEKAILEIGSGTGQHAVYFSENLQSVDWRTSDLKENHAGINAWIDGYYKSHKDRNNLRRPFILDAEQYKELDVENLGVVFTANTLHIMSWPQVESLFKNIGPQLPDKCLLIIYGPFNYKGQYTSKSNAEFDLWLKQVPYRGIRDFEAVVELASHYDIQFIEDHEMPANNRCLVFKKTK